MTRKFIAPDNGVKQVEIQGMRTGVTERIARDHSGFFQAMDKRQANALKSEGFVEASLMGASNTNTGYICPACGFACWFVVCGRCGEQALKAGTE